MSSSAHVVAIIQTRMTSTRLPGKTLAPLAGRPMLEHIIDRARRIQGVHAVWIATTNDGTEQPILDLCTRLKAPVYQGSVDDVLARYAETAAKAKADVIVRITSDCPFIDPEVSARVVRYYIDSLPRFAFVSNTGRRTYPRGLDTEVFSRESLDAAHHEATERLDREHVTRFIFKHPQRFSVGNVADNVDFSQLRLTVDTPEDYALVSRLYADLYPSHPQFTYPDVLNWFDHHPDMTRQNAHIAQKDAHELQ